MRAAVLALPLTLLGAGVAHAATFAVDSPGTAVDAAPGDGTCRTAGGACTLRAAVAESEALGGQNAITPPAGTYSLAAPIDAGQNRLRISGAGAATTIVDGNSRAP